MSNTGNGNNRQALLVFNDPHAMRINNDLAMEIGFEEHIVFLQIEFLISITRNLREGKYWTYQTLEDLRTKHFRYWSTSKISRILQKLEANKLILIGNFNKHKSDRTQWFALNPEGINMLTSVRLVDLPDPGIRNRKPLLENILQNEKCISQNERSILQNEKCILQNETTIPKTSPENTTKTSSEIKSRIQFNQDKGVPVGDTGDKSNQGSRPSEQEKPPLPPKPAPVTVPLPEPRGTSVRSGKEQIDLDADQLQIVKDLFDWTCDLLSPGEPHQKDWPDIAWLVSRGMGFSEGKALYQELIDSGLALAHWGMVRSKFGRERARSKRADLVPSRPPLEQSPEEPVDTSQVLALIEVIDQVQYENRAKRLPSSKLEELVKDVCINRQIPFDEKIFVEFGRGRR